MIIWGNLWRAVAGLAISVVVAFVGIIALAVWEEIAKGTRRYLYEYGVYWIMFVFAVYVLIIGKVFR